MIQNICCCDLYCQFKRSLQGEVYPDDDAEAEDFIDEVVLAPSWWTLGEEGAEDSGVEISSMSAYGPVGLEPFLLKALLKELRSCTEKKYETDLNDASKN